MYFSNTFIKIKMYLSNTFIKIKMYFDNTFIKIFLFCRKNTKSSKGTGHPNGCPVSRILS